MSDALDRSVTVTELAAMDDTVDVRRHFATAFVGRALRGPLNTPVLVRSMTEFSRRFGGVWPKSSMGPAVQQYFEHGGRRLYIVRVANGARGARIQLQTNADPLVLTAVDPGSAETLRVSVDYDRVAPGDDEHFNLTVQRLAPGSEVLVDQEIHNLLSCDSDSDQFVVDRLQDSALISATAPSSKARPLATIGPHVHRGNGYVLPDRRGVDGAELSDYDLIGSAAENTGLFSLEGVNNLDVLYLPPIGRGRDIGPAATMAADLFCRRRGAMLVVDPPLGWSSAEEALRGVDDQGFTSPNMLSYFPRMLDRDNPQGGPRAMGGALAGLIGRADERVGPWCDPSQLTFPINARYRPTIAVEPESAARLVRAGLNVLAAFQGVRARFHGGVTLARRNTFDMPLTRLSTRRLCLYVSNAVGQATRWAVFRDYGNHVTERVRDQVQTFLTRLHTEGAFASDKFDVQCQVMQDQSSGAHLRGLTIVIGFVPAGYTEAVWLTLHQDVQGCHATKAAFTPSPNRIVR